MPLVSSRIACGLACLLLPGLYSSPAVAREDVQSMVDGIVELRSQVNDLDDELARLKDQHAGRMNALAREEGQLRSQQERQRLRVNRLERQLLEHRQAIAEAGQSGDALKPALQDAITAARHYVNTALPFRQADRRRELDELENSLASGDLDPARVANRLWSFVADELRLVGESGLHRQSIVIDGDEQLVEVARLGMMQLYFRTESGDYGHAVRDGDGWAFQLVEGAPARDIRDYMRSLQQKVRSGYFVLPRPLIRQEQ